MFVLLRRARAWREEMLARGVFAPAELLELEDHLLEDARHLVLEGRPDAEAFTEALRRIGTGEELLSEFRLAHELSGGTVGTWLTKLVPWGLRLCRWARALFVLCLPGLAMAVPGLMVARLASDGGWLSLGSLLDSGQPVPPPSLACRTVDFATRNTWWLLPLALAVLLLPTVYRIRHLRDRTDASIATVVGEELAEAQPLLLAGLVAYPLIGSGFLQVALAPLLRMLTVLGG